MATPTPSRPSRKREATHTSVASSSRPSTRSRTTSEVSSRPRPQGKGKGKGKAPRSVVINPQLRITEAEGSGVKREGEDDGEAADASGPQSEWTARWNEEFFEIVDELPLELHRSFALIRELETKTQAQMARIGRDAIAYRDIRLGLNSQGEAPAPSTAKALRLSILRSIAESSADALRASEEKVGLAVSAYDWVDRHIRRLDHDLQKSESSLLLGLREGTEASRGVMEALRMPAAAGDSSEAVGQEGAGAADGAGDEASSRAANDAWADDSAMAASSVRTSPVTRSSRRSSARSASAGGAAVAPLASAAAAPSPSPPAPTPSAATAKPAITAASTVSASAAPASGAATRSGVGVRARAAAKPVAAAAVSTRAPRKRSTSAKAASASPVQVHESLVPDMAIDPNEPTYCYCDQVSFGDMVACDNDDCPREWYHLSCVGLDQPPPRHSKWYCLYCAPPGFRHAAPADPSLPLVPPEYKKAKGGGSNKRHK